jgi:hypothetical protein
MCTLIVKWDPGADMPLLVGANRDERPERSEPWAVRPNGILCPLDVRKGTWIGINNRGVFAALTNLDRKEPADRGRHSRGLLVLKALEQATAADAVTKVVGMMMENIYNAFNLLIANQTRMVAVVGHGACRRVELIHFEPGIHIATGWGVDNWDVPRAKIIRGGGGTSCYPMEWQPWTNLDDMKRLLSYHSGKDKAKHDVCVHSAKESHVTVSSCIISVASEWQSIDVQHVGCAPCKANWWNRVRMICES